MDEIGYTYKGYFVSEVSMEESVKSIDYDKLDNLPKRERFWEKDGWKDWDIYYRRHAKYKQCNTIFIGSVGKNISDIKKKIDPLLFKRDSFKTFSSRWLEQHSWEYKGDARYDRYYIDNNNCLQIIKTKRTRNRLPLTWQQHYKIKQNNKQFCKTKKDKGLMELKMINKPDLLKFYLQLIQKRKSYLGLQISTKEYLNRWKSSYPKKDWWSRYMYKSNLQKLKDYKIEQIEYQIENLEKGNFNIFYEDAAYLYNQQKECHHFAQP